MVTAGVRLLLIRHLQGIAGDPVPSKWARVRGVLALYGIPLVVAVCALVTGKSAAPAAEALVGGLSLAAGVLIAVFAQLASWRGRLDARGEAHWRSEVPARRAVDSAVAHTLVGVLVAMGAATASTLLLMKVPNLGVWNVASVYLATLTVCFYVLIVRAVFVAYEDSVDPGIRAADERLLIERSKGK